MLSQFSAFGPENSLVCKYYSQNLFCGVPLRLCWSVFFNFLFLILFFSSTFPPLSASLLYFLVHSSRHNILCSNGFSGDCYIFFYKKSFPFPFITFRLFLFLSIFSDPLLSSPFSFIPINFFPTPSSHFSKPFHSFTFLSIHF